MERHVQVPEIDDLKLKNLKPKDLLVYAAIAKFKNSKTQEAYPSIKAIGNEIGMTAPTIIKSIKALEAANLLTVQEREGTSSVYHFTPYENFQGFSYEFLNKTNLSNMEKAYIISIQDKLFLNDYDRTGSTSYTDKELSQTLNMDRSTISKLDKSLQSKGILELVKLNSIDSETGLAVNQKIFNIDEFANGVVFELQKHKHDIISLQKTQEKQNKRQNDLEDKMRKLEVILRAKDINIEDIDEEYKKVSKSIVL